MDRQKARQRACELVDQMTLEEKASQLRYDAPAIERLGIPAYNWWNESLHGVARAGVATMFPQSIGMAAAFDPDIMEEVGCVIAEEGRAKYNMQSRRGDRDIYKGLTFWAPNVNIFRDPRWGRGHETYGEDPYLTARLGVRFIRGMQGDGEYLKTAACAKHFAVHSGPEADRHHFNAIASKRDMEDTYLPAFEACVKEAKVEAVMGAYNRTNGEVCCGSPSLQEILRGKWGFEGHFVSDCWAIRDFHENHKITNSPEESVVLALENGTDVNCGCTYQRILNAVEQGMLDEKYITESAIRLFTTRFLLGMFDATPMDEIPYTVVESRKNLALEDRVAKESFVLLKNNGLLPLHKESLNAVAVVGPNADSRIALRGNYHGDASRNITVLEGIQDYLGEDVRVWYSQGCDIIKDNVDDLSDPTMCDRLAEAEECAALSEVVIVVLGLDETIEGEQGDEGNQFRAFDKEGLNLPFQQMELLRGMIATGKPVVLVNMTGSAVNLRTAEDHCAAVLQAWYPGGNGGKNIAEILFGETSPSGKLPITFYEKDDDLPDVRDYSMKGRTYRYFEGTPLYPFGYGLTYGDCEALSVSAKVMVRKADATGSPKTPSTKPEGTIYSGTSETKHDMLYELDNECEFSDGLAEGVESLSKVGMVPDAAEAVEADAAVQDSGCRTDASGKPGGTARPKAGLTAFGSSDDYGAAVGIDGLEVTVLVRNSGSVATSDVVQVYVREDGDIFDARNPHLSAVRRITLGAGEEAEVSLTVAPHELTSVDEDGGRAIRAKSFTVYAGFSQPDARSAELTGHTCASCSVSIG